MSDGGVTSYDDPPSGPWLTSPERIEADPASADGRDIARADDAEAGDAYDRGKATWALYDQLAAPPPSAFDDPSGKRPPD